MPPSPPPQSPVPPAPPPPPPKKEKTEATPEKVKEKEPQLNPRQILEAKKAAEKAAEMASPAKKTVKKAPPRKASPLGRPELVAACSIGRFSRRSGRPHGSPTQTGRRELHPHARPLTYVLGNAHIPTLPACPQQCIRRTADAPDSYAASSQ